jgi:hypothetical protein
LLSAVWCLLPAACCLLPAACCLLTGVVMACLTQLNELSPSSIEQPEARAALVWIMGQFGQHLPVGVDAGVNAGVDHGATWAVWAAPGSWGSLGSTCRWVGPYLPHSQRLRRAGQGGHTA